jgi:hypothetical protein
MNTGQETTAGPATRRLRFLLGIVPTAIATILATMPSEAHAQVVAGGDFDIDDNRGSAVGNRVRLTGRVGFGTERGSFVLINAADAAQDVDRDGYTPGIDFLNLVIEDTTDFVNIADPSHTILRRNIVFVDFLNPLRNGFNNVVGFYVNVPNGTPAGTYVGRFTIVDRVRPPGLNPNGEAIRTDFLEVEIEVLPQTGIGLVEGDSAATLDSLTLRGRPGQTVNGVVRVANLGNVPLSNIRLEATDLVATSGTGLRIRRERITFSPQTLTQLAFADTQRITVTVRIPVGLLAGAYRGELIAQGEGVDAIRVPLTVIVTTPGDIVFETNPVIGRAGDQAVIIFNADPGSRWDMAIFDMQGLIAFRATGTVFAGSGGGGGGQAFPGDEAVRYTWNLRNGRGEAVAGGMYYVVIDARQDERNRQLRGKLMVIR